MATTKTPIVVPVDNKSFGWCGGLSGCIRTSTAVVLPAKAKLKLPKPTEVSSSEEEEEEEEEERPEVFDKLTKLIDNFLDQAGSQEDEWSGKLASAAASLFTSSSGWIDSLSSKSKTVFDELTSTKFRDIATTADEICKVLAKTHWAAAGLLVVAAVINNIEKVQRVDKECMELLRSIHTVGTSLNRFSLLRHRPAEMAANIKRAESVIPLGTALCLGIIQSGKLKKFFQSRTNESKILSCRQKLERLQNDLNFQLHFADYAERHEPGGRLQDESKSKFDLGIKKITKQEESQKNTGPSEKSTPGNGDTTPAPRSTTDRDSSENKEGNIKQSASQQQTTPATPADTSKGQNNRLITRN